MKRMFILAAVISALLAGCSNEDVTTSGKVGLGVSATASITGTVSTRSLVDAFDATTNKDIKVFVVGTGYSSKADTYTFAGGSWASSPTSNDKIFLSDEVATVYGYFPATATPDYPNKTIVNVDVKSEQDFKATTQDDYMYATGRGANTGTELSPVYSYPLATASNNVAEGKNKVDLYFHHALAKLQFVIKKASTYDGTGKLTSVELSKTGAFLAGNAGVLPLDGTQITGLSAVDKITFSDDTGLTANVDGVSVNGLVAPVSLPASVTAGSASDDNSIKLTLTVDGKLMSVYLPTATVSKWDAGKVYTYTVTVNGNLLSVNSVSIVNWLSGGEEAFSVK
jgi:hypothetical protein